MRNSEDYPFEVEGVTYTYFDGKAGTHCEVEEEFISSTGAIYNHAHFSARELCSAEND